MRLALPLALALFSAGALIGLFAGCSEEKPEDVDSTLPGVAIIAPLSADRLGFEVRDSTEVVVEAFDNDRISQVQVYFHKLGSTTMNQIGSPVTEPDSTGFYRVFWNTAGIQNGSQCFLRATATDHSGNIGASESVPVQIVNTEGIRRPYANFVATPSEGTVLTEFCFDASFTRDDISDNVDLFVQWDFQDDRVWDRTLEELLTATANDAVCHTYPVPDTYTVVLEVYNQYYSIPLGIPDVQRRNIIVKPAFGDPRPPHDDYIQVPAGNYLLGAVQCTPGEGCDIFDNDEAVDDTLIIRISNPVHIEKYEVTNALFVDYLNASQDSNFVEYDALTRDVRRQSDSKLLLTLDDDLTRVKYQFADSSFWVDETHGQHPVTGVTWYGAYEYAAFYGLRLPTEAEWEAAARFQEPGWTYSYPWMDHGFIDETYANFNGSGDDYEGDVIPTVPVGSYDGLTFFGGYQTQDAASPLDTYDQAGNVAEWCADWFYALTYQELANQSIMPIDPQGPPTGTARSIRGGSWAQYRHELRVTNRQAADPRLAAAWLGFRTAYTQY